MFNPSVIRLIWNETEQSEGRIRWFGQGVVAKDVGVW